MNPLTFLFCWFFEGDIAQGEIKLSPRGMITIGVVALSVFAWVIS